jgi:hypothetical protein
MPPEPLYLIALYWLAILSARLIARKITRDPQTR